LQRIVDESIDQKVQKWILNHKGVTITAFFGLLFLFFGIGDELNSGNTSGPVVMMMQTVLIIILFLGMMIFVYNFGYIAIILAVDEGLNEEERLLLKWMVRRAAIISVVWFCGVLLLLMLFQIYPYLLASSNCFLLTFIFYFIRKGENPLTEGTSI
jgi:hypothetical protein